MKIQLLALFIKHCEQCGAPIDKKYKLCYKCQKHKTTATAATFTNRCGECGKPIDRKYRLCYQCHRLQRGDNQ